MATMMIDPSVRAAITTAVDHPLPLVADTLAALLRAAGATIVAPMQAELVVAPPASCAHVDAPRGARRVALLDHVESRLLTEAQAAGFCAAVPLDLPLQELRAALSVVIAGGALWPTAPREPQGARRSGRRLDTLSNQQFRVLDLMSQGRLNKQIAWDLQISEGTVKSHVSAILKKLGVERRTQAIATFITTGEHARMGAGHLSRATHAPW